MIQQSAESLEQVAQTYRMNSLQDRAVRQACIDVLSPWLSAQGRALEIGCSDGFMTEQIAARVAAVDVVEATQHFIAMAAERSLANVRFHHQHIERYQPDDRYDFIFCTWVLTHIPDATELLKVLRQWLKPAGMLFVVVPNARGLSRQLAQAMGLLTDLYALTDNDRNHGHCRAYDRPRLNAELMAAGYRSVAEGGLMLKPLADFQMDALLARQFLQQAHLDGLFALGQEYPDLASAIYSICRADS